MTQFGSAEGNAWDYVVGQLTRPLTDGNNVPDGAMIVVKSTSVLGATVRITPGPTGTPIELGTSGSITWTDSRTVPYATVDQGTAVVHVSSAASDFTDPTSVAAATAARLVTSGIPVVNVLDTLFQGTLDASPAATRALNIASAGYASVIVSGADAAAVNPCQIEYKWQLPSTLNVADDQIGSDDPPASCPLAMPVIAPILRLVNLEPNPAKLVVLGSSRVLDGPKLLSTQGGAVRRFTYTGSLTAGVPVQLTSADSGPMSTTFDGPFNLSLDPNGTSGRAAHRSIALSGGRPLAGVIGSTGPVTVMSAAQQPRQAVTWWFVPDTSTATGNVTLVAWGGS